jgi:hypothetical protein
VVVKALRYKSGGPGIDSRFRRGFFLWQLTVPCALESTQPLNNEYQVNPGGKGGRCVRLTTYHHTVPLSSNLGALTNPRPLWACMACYGSALPLHVIGQVVRGYTKISLTKSRSHIKILGATRVR